MKKNDQIFPFTVNFNGLPNVESYENPADSLIVKYIFNFFKQGEERWIRTWNHGFDIMTS